MTRRDMEAWNKVVAEVGREEFPEALRGDHSAQRLASLLQEDAGKGDSVRGVSPAIAACLVDRIAEKLKATQLGPPLIVSQSVGQKRNISTDSEFNVVFDSLRHTFSDECLSQVRRCCAL